MSPKVQVVDNEETADAAGMLGSPTMLVDGIDPFAQPGQAPSLSCRLYLDEHGRPAGAPSLGQLRRVFTSGPTDVGAEATDRRSTPLPAPRLHAARARSTPSDPTDRAVHQAILRALAATGHEFLYLAALVAFTAAGGSTAGTWSPHRQSRSDHTRPSTKERDALRYRQASQQPGAGPSVPDNEAGLLDHVG
jgi:hypothetical protein